MPTGNDWSSFKVDQWRTALYRQDSYFAQLFKDTTEFIKRWSRPDSLIIEVGCGTGEALKALEPFHRIGIDYNPSFVEYCKNSVIASTVRFVVSDAQNLVSDMTTENSLLRQSVPHEWLSSTAPRVIICVGNTVGIMPEDVRTRVYQQMIEAAGPGGVAIVVFWNAQWFGDAVQNFYFMNPQLCGEFDGSAIDLKTHTLQTPSGYKTHWTGLEEARSGFKCMGFEILEAVEIGKGVAVVLKGS